MIALKLHDGRGKLCPADQAHTFLCGPGFWLDTTGHASRNDAAKAANGVDQNGVVIPAPNLTYAELVDYATAAGAPAADLERYKAAAS